MIVRQLKLKLYKSQETQLIEWLWNLTGLYNWAIRTIKLNAENKKYLSVFDINNLISGHGKRIGIHSQVMQGVIKQAWNSWSKCFKKICREPKLKGFKNKFNSIPFPKLGKYSKNNRIFIPGIGETRFFKQDIPEGTIKCGRIIKKASGWYLIITIDTSHKISGFKETDSQIGIDTGFHDLAVLSNGTKYLNDRIFIKAQKQMAKVQRSKNRKKIARFHEHLSNKRKDRNHKIALDIVRNHKEIYITNDNLKGQAKKFGKSVGDAGISQLRSFLLYKGSSCGRKVILVDSHRTTMTCSNCWSLTGPTGLSGLAVRDWVCSVCRTQHDRDINSGQVVLKIGLGLSLKSQEIFQNIHGLKSMNDMRNTSNQNSL